MAPTGKGYHLDWIMGTGSNVHVTNNKDWFNPGSFTAFKTTVETGADTPADVLGIGTVKLPVVTSSKSIDVADPVILHNVLFAPSFICNVVGAPILKEYKLQTGPSGGKLISKQGDDVAILDHQTLCRFRLVGHVPNETSLDGENYMIRAWWPDNERKRWRDFKTASIQSSDASH